MAGEIRQTGATSGFDGGYLCLILLERVLALVARSVKNSTVSLASGWGPREYDSAGNERKLTNRIARIMQKIIQDEKHYFLAF